MWNDRFKNEKYVYGTEPNVFLKEMQPILSGKYCPSRKGKGETPSTWLNRG